LRDKLIIIRASTAVLKSLDWIVNAVFNYLDSGTFAAKKIDKRDKKPNNGYIDF